MVIPTLDRHTMNGIHSVLELNSKYNSPPMPATIDEKIIPLRMLAILSTTPAIMNATKSETAKTEAFLKMDPGKYFK